MNTTTTKIAGEAMTDEQIIEMAKAHCVDATRISTVLSFARALLASQAAVLQKPYGWVGAGNYWTADELTAKQVSIRTDTPMVPVYVAPTALAPSADALTRELLDTLQMMVLHFTKTPLTLADSKARGKAHEVIAKAYEQIGYATPAQSTRDACQIDNFSTRVCKYGTRSCISEHTAPTAALEKGDGRDAIRNAVDLLNNLAERQELAGFPLTAASTRHTAKELAAALSQKAGEQHA